MKGRLIIKCVAFALVSTGYIWLIYKLIESMNIQNRGELFLVALLLFVFTIVLNRLIRAIRRHNNSKIVVIPLRFLLCSLAIAVVFFVIKNQGIFKSPALYEATNFYDDGYSTLVLRVDSTFEHTNVSKSILKGTYALKNDTLLLSEKLITQHGAVDTLLLDTIQGGIFFVRDSLNHFEKDKTILAHYYYFSK